MNREMKKTVRILAVIFVFCMSAVAFMFNGLLNIYRDNTALGSASHLIEINLQGRTNIESFLNSNRSVATELSRRITNGDILTENELFSEISELRELWHIDDVYIYTKDGLCLNFSGVAQSNGDASATAAQAASEGSVFRLVKSQAEYVVSVKTALTVRGSTVAAVSIVHSLDTLIDDIGLVSFSGHGSIYLTRRNGIRICQSSGAAESGVYNLRSVFENGSLKDLTRSGVSLEETMDAGSSGAFLYAAKGSEDQYVVVTPVNFLNETLYLFNIVPRGIVNATMNQYSKNIALLSAAVITLTLLLLGSFFLIYRRRALKYDSDLLSRERLFDLLVKETSNAFFLLGAGRDRPIYISSNIGTVIADGVKSISKTDSGYRLEGETGESEGGALAEINTALAGWDGKSTFVSGYVPYTVASGQQYLRLTLYPTSSAAGEFVGIVRDATPDYRHEQSLHEALTLADSANRAKTQFLSSVSHDIRTPLNAIINMTRFLYGTVGDNKKAREQLDILQQSSAHLLNLINNVLDMSRIESGKLSFVNEPFDVKTVLNDICEIIRPLCESKRQQFTFTMNPVLHPNLFGDSLRLNQILINILNNAMKFTPEHGSISFEVSELPQIKSEEVPFRFTVRDNGIGIPNDKLPRIFEPFSRVDSQTVRQTEGSGLGLAITKRFVDALGGSIAVSSTVGLGTVFTIELTYMTAMSVLPQNVRRSGDKGADVSGAKILLAEDNAVNADIAEEIFGSWGAAVDTVSDGAAAAERFASQPAGTYDMIFMDIQMPVMNGYEATRKIRSFARSDAAAIPIIAMTANAFAEDVERARAAGMDAHISKPIDPSELRRITAKFFTRPGRSE